MTAAEAARLAGVSRERIWQWCKARGFDPAKARANRLAVFYARQLLRMSKRDRVTVAPAIAAKGRRPQRKRPDKVAQRVEIDAKVIDFTKAGGKIRRIPPRRI